MSNPPKKSNSSDNVRFKCNICEYEFIIEEYLSQHIKAVHDEETNIVDPQDVKQEIDNLENIEDDPSILNIELYESEEVKSPLENSDIVIEQHLNPKNGQIHKRNVFKCKSCDFQAVRNMHLTQHILSKHSSGEEIKKHNKKCPECDYTSFRPMCIKRHFEAIHEKRTYECNWTECVFRTLSRQALKDHIKLIHRGMKFICDECGFETTTQNLLSQHGKTVHGSKTDPTVCKQCSFNAHSGPA